MRESAVPVLPCPDCGGRVPLRDASPRAWQECPKCGAGFRPVKADLDRALAADARRSSRPPKSRAPKAPAPAVVFEDVSAPTPTKAERPADSARRTKRPRPAAAAASRPASKSTPKPFPEPTRRRRRFDSPEDGFDDSEDPRDDWDERPRRTRSSAPPRRASTREKPVRRTTDRRREASSGTAGTLLGGLMAGGFGTVLVVGLVGLKIWARYERAQRRHADNAAATSPAALNQPDAWNPTLAPPQHEFASDGIASDRFGDSSGFDGGAFPPGVQLNPQSVQPSHHLVHDPFRSNPGFPGDPSWDRHPSIHESLRDSHLESMRWQEETRRKHEEEFQRRHDEQMERMGLTPSGFPQDRFGGPGGFGGGPGF